MRRVRNRRRHRMHHNLAAHGVNIDRLADRRNRDKRTMSIDLESCNLDPRTAHLVVSNGQVMWDLITVEAAREHYMQHLQQLRDNGWREMVPGSGVLEHPDYPETIIEL